MSGRDGVRNPLSRDFHMLSLFYFAFPTILMMVCMGFYTVTDTIFVSRLVNTDALSALNIICPVINVIVGLGTMLAAGGNAIIAREMGAGEDRRASKDFTLIVCAGVVLGIFITVLGLIFIDEIIWGLGASEILFPYCKEYLQILLCFTPASILQVLFQNLIVTAGRPGFGMILSIGAGAANVILDYIFMGLMQMGIAGAALGTGIGYVIPAVVGSSFFIVRKRGLKFLKPRWDMWVLTESCFNGFSEMVSQMATAVTTFLFNRVMMRLLGENGVAAITIIIYIQFFLTALYIGFSMGVAPVISYTLGKNDKGRLREIIEMCLKSVLGISIVVFVGAMAAGDWLVRIFAPVGTNVYETARSGFLVFSVSFLFCGINIFTSAAFTALSDGRISAIISSLRTFVFLIPALFILTCLWAELGVWLAVPVAEGLTLIFSVFFLKGRKILY